MAFPARVYLTGFMASGKSTVGYIVANTIGYAFVDLDEEIARAEGRSVQEIFRDSGEAYFRKLEAKALKATRNARHTVAALGGGALVSDEAYGLIPEGSSVVYLETSPSVLARRLYYGRVVRPLMTDDDGKRLSLEAIQARIEELLAQRVEYYRRADIIVRSGDRRIGRTVDAVVAALRAAGVPRPTRAVKPASRKRRRDP